MIALALVAAYLAFAVIAAWTYRQLNPDPTVSQTIREGLGWPIRLLAEILGLN